MHTLSRRDLMSASAALAPLAFTGRVLAQTAVEVPAGEPLDAVIALRLLIAGRKQVALCEMAREHLKHEDALKFAEAEINEHEQLKKQLLALGFEYRVAGDDRRRPGEQATDRVARASFVVPAPGLPAATTDLLLLEHEIAQQCLATQGGELTKFKDADLDRRFVEHQLDAHYDLYDQGVTFRKHASEEMAKLLEAGRTVIERHITACKDLRQELT